MIDSVSWFFERGRSMQPLLTGHQRATVFRVKTTLSREWLTWTLLIAGVSFVACSNAPSAPTPGGETVNPPARAVTTLSGDLCTTERLPSGVVCSEPFQRTHTIPIERQGTITLNVDYGYVGDYYMNYLSLEVRCGSVVVLEKRFRKLWEKPPTILPDEVTGPIHVPVTQPCLYEFRLSNFIADTKGGHQTTYRVEVDHPQ